MQFSVRVPSLPEGLHIFTVKVRNEHNKISGPSATVPYVVDMTPPTGNFTVPADGGAVASFQPRLVVAAADTGAGVKQVSFQYRAGTTGTFQSINADLSAPYEATWGDLNLPGEGAYQFRAIVRDNAGNETTVGPIDVIVDTTKPTVTLLAPAAQGIFFTSAHTMLFAADAADPASSGRASQRRTEGRLLVRTEERTPRRVCVVDGGRLHGAVDVDCAGLHGRLGRQLAARW